MAHTIKAKAKADGVTYAIETFHSITELLAANRSRPHRHNNNALEGHKGDGWAGVGCNSYDDAERMLREGWDGPVDEFKAKIKNIKTVGGNRITTQNAVVGFAPIVPLAIQGVPQAMINTTYKPIKTKVVDVYYDMTASSMTSESDIKKAGREVLAAVVSLERQGYRARVWMVQTYKSGDSVDMLRLKIKDERQPLDIKKVMFPIVHTAMFRRIGFAWFERSPVTQYRPCYGHGIAYDQPLGKTSAAMKEFFGGQPVYLSAAKMIGGAEKIESMMKGENQK